MTSSESGDFATFNDKEMPVWRFATWAEVDSWVAMDPEFTCVTLPGTPGGTFHRGGPPFTEETRAAVFTVEEGQRD